MKKSKVIKSYISFRRIAQGICFLLYLIMLFYFIRPGDADYGRENKVLFPLVKLFLYLDPLVGVSTALATKVLNGSLVAAGIVLLICVVFPRWFCGYVCPMGTLIDIFDWSLAGRFKKNLRKPGGWWRHLRFYLLSVILIAAVFGVLLSGFVAAIPVLTRGMVYLFAPLQDGLSIGWKSAAGITAGQIVSIIIFIGILGLGFLRPRFWCAYVCPSGAMLSLASFFSLTRRIVDETCIACGRCVGVCSFDEIAPDYTTRPLACTACRQCESVCPKDSIKFTFGLKACHAIPSTQGVRVDRFSSSRRVFLLNAMGTLGTGVGAAAGLRFERDNYLKHSIVRPPGSIPEERFRTQCIRCGECLKACPVNVLQPAGLECGIDGLWTPMLMQDFAGCQPFCNNCGQVCPTGAIRKLPLDEKQAVRIGLAEINMKICLAHCDGECGLCYEVCAAAGHNAIDFIRVSIEYDQWGMPIMDSGYDAPVVLKDKCVGCGLCQAGCHALNVVGSRQLNESAVKVTAGTGKEDRIITGSYKTLREECQKQAAPAPKQSETNSSVLKPSDSNPSAPKRSEEKDQDYLPDFLR